jgi:hypothetical protein
MATTKKLLIEGLDRLGKDTLIRGIQDRYGYHVVLHFRKPELLQCYEAEASPQRSYQQASFATMFQLLHAPGAAIICNRAHLGECVYAPMYRGYSGDYVFGLEQQFGVGRLLDVRLVLLTEDFARSKHFVDDGQSLGTADKREREQSLFLAAFEKSMVADKRVVCVTDAASGDFRSRSAILDSVWND